MVNKNTQKPYLLKFSKIGSTNIGYLSVVSKVPFEIKRIYYSYFTPESVVRGRHAHHKTAQILIAAAGRIIVTTESIDDKISTFILDKPNIGLYIPTLTWHTMQYTHSSVQIVVASEPYHESDYIRDYNSFNKMKHLNR